MAGILLLKNEITNCLIDDRSIRPESGASTKMHLKGLCTLSIRTK